MYKVIGATIIAAAALATTAALAGENAVDDKRQELAQLWGKQDQAKRQSRISTSRGDAVTFGETFSNANARNAWADNWRGGRASPPAGD